MSDNTIVIKYSTLHIIQSLQQRLLKLSQSQLELSLDRQNTDLNESGWRQKLVSKNNLHNAFFQSKALAYEILTEYFWKFQWKIALQEFC